MQLATLPQLAKDIDTEHEAATAKAVEALEHARRCGELLIQAKAQCAHGEWLPWLEANCKVSPRQSQRYMKVANNWEAIESKYDAASHLTIDGAITMLAKPELTVHPLVAEIRGPADIAGDSFASLKRSIADVGLISPILVDHEHRIIDGRRRYRACLDLGVAADTYQIDNCRTDEDVMHVLTGAHMWKPYTPSEAVEVVERIRQCREEAERVEKEVSPARWGQADCYRELVRRGWRPQRIAKRCNVSRSTVSKFVKLAKKYPLPDKRPVFREAFLNLEDS